MSKLKSKYLIATGIVWVTVICFGTTEAIAQVANTGTSGNSTTNEAVSENEIIVRASRREESLQNVAMSVSLINVDDFAKAGLNSLSEILPFVPGVALQNAGGTYENNVYIRGVNATGSGGVGTYIDDIPYGSSTGYAGGGQPLDGTLLDLQGINILKGPQGTLYGSSSMGGLIRFDTKEPSFSDWSANVSTDLSTTRRGGLNQLYRAGANGPLIEGRLGVTFTGFWSQKDGYIDNVTIPLKGWDDYEYYGGSGSLRFEATEQWTLKVTGLFQKSSQDGLAGIQINGLDNFPKPGVDQGDPVTGDRFGTDQLATTPTVFETYLVGLTSDYDFGFATLSSVTSYQEQDFELAGDITTSFAPLADLFFPANAPHTSAIVTQERGWNKFTQELRLTSKSNGIFEWILGGYYSNEKSYNIQEVVTQPEEPLFFLDIPSEFTEKAIFATGTYYFAPNFDVSLGIRHAGLKNSVVSDNGGTILSISTPPNSDEQSTTTYLANVRFRPNERTSIYARAASGYRPGGANLVLVHPITKEPLTPVMFGSDKLWSFEAGVKGSVGALSYDLAAYYIDWSDYLIRVSPPGAGGLSAFANAEKASSVGAEAGLRLNVMDGLSVEGTLTYTDAKLEADEPALGGLKGEQLPNTPKWAGTLSANYNFDIGMSPAFIGASWRHTGKIPYGYDQSGLPFSAGAPRIVHDSYNVVSLSAGVSLSQAVEVSIYADNLFDEYAYVNISPSSTGQSTAIPLRPRTIGTVIKLNF